HTLLEAQVSGDTAAEPCPRSWRQVPAGGSARLGPGLVRGGFWVRILVTNDDGIHAPGLRALVQELVVLGSVAVVARARDRRWPRRGVTGHPRLRVTAVEWGIGVHAYSLYGTPADCVALAVEALIADGCDLVLSAVNRAPTSGPDVLYSGTVSGAVE